MSPECTWGLIWSPGPCNCQFNQLHAVLLKPSLIPKQLVWVPTGDLMIIILFGRHLTSLITPIALPMKSLHFCLLHWDVLVVHFLVLIAKVCPFFLKMTSEVCTLFWSVSFEQHFATSFLQPKHQRYSLNITVKLPLT